MRGRAADPGAEELEQVAALVRRESGIVIKPAQFPSLLAAVERIAPRLGPRRLLQSVSDPGQGRVLLERLVDEVTVKETFFLRHVRELDAIDWLALRATGQGRIRVWSAACATGEEAYTLGILASEAFTSHAPPVEILGTDISPTALARAREGRYGWRSLRELSAAQRERYFRSNGDAHLVSSQLRDLVSFAQHNLVRDQTPPLGHQRFDLIVCRNVLIYFDPETVARTIAALERTLRPGGMLILGAADSLTRTNGGLASAVVPRTQALAAANRLRQRATAVPQLARAASGAPRPMPAGMGSQTRNGSTAPTGSPARSGSPAQAGAVSPDASGPAEVKGEPPPEPSTSLGDVLGAIEDRSVDDTLRITADLLAQDPLNVDAYFIRGVAELATQEPEAAVRSLRRALYLDPGFGLAAFKLARAHEASGDGTAAARAYEQALNSLRHDDPRQQLLLEQVDVGDIAAACRSRISELKQDRRAVTP